MGDHVVAELGTLNFCGTFHESRKIVSDTFGGDSSVQTFENEIGGFHPPHVTQHHFAAQNHAARINFIQIGIFGGGAMGGFKDSMAAVVVNITARGNANATYLRGQGIG